MIGILNGLIEGAGKWAMMEDNNAVPSSELAGKKNPIEDTEV